MVARGRTKGSKNVNGKIQGSVLLVKSLNPNWSALQVRNYLLRNKPTEKSIIPKLRTIQNILQEGKPNLDAVSQSGLDMPWHLGTLEKHPLSPEAVPYILLVQNFAEKYPDPHFKKPQAPVTIRQAKWISRLCAIVGDIHKLKDKKRMSAAAYLYDWSKTYATHEIICKLSDPNAPVDTSELDKALPNSYAVVVGMQYVIFNTKDNSFFVDPKTAKQLEKDGEK